MSALNLFAEKRLTLTQAARRLGVNPSTVWRWTLRGCRGHKLETLLVGGQRYTSVEALERFVERLNGAAAAAAVATEGGNASDARLDSVEAELDKLGI